jgi:hypothetical protein
VSQTNGKKSLIANDFEEHSLWFRDERDDLYYPVRGDDDFPNHQYHLLVRANFKTRRRRKLKGFLVGVENIYCIVIFYKDKLFALNRSSLWLSDSIEDIKKMGLMPKDFSPVKYVSSINSVYNEITGEFDLFKKITLKEQLGEFYNDDYDETARKVARKKPHTDLKPSLYKKILHFIRKIPVFLKYLFKSSGYVGNSNVISQSGLNSGENYDYFDIVKITASRGILGRVRGKYAVIISKGKSKNYFKHMVYGLYILNFNYEIEFYITAKKSEFVPIEQKLVYSFMPRSENLRVERLRKLFILPKPGSSLKLSNKMRLAVYEILEKYNFINVFNKCFNALIYIQKEIPVGESLLRAHGSNYFRYETQTIDIFETLTTLPNQKLSTPCPANLVQVEIYFTMRMNRGDNLKPFECHPYTLSLLVDTENSTIWDGRGALLEADD